MKNTYAFLALMAALAQFGCASSGGSAPASSAQNDARPCKSNFTSSGSFFTGQTFKTFEDFPAQSQAAAFDNLVPAISAGGYQILNANKDVGIISAAQAVSFSRGGQTTPLNVSVRKGAPSGVRVEITFSLAGGLAASSETIQGEFCRILASVGQSQGSTAAVRAPSTQTERKPSQAKEELMPPDVLSITSSQRARIQKALNVKSGKAQLDAQIKDASSTIADVLRIHSCWQFGPNSGDRNPLGAYEAPGASLFGPALASRPAKMQYHPKTSCVALLRLQGWKMPAANALGFEAIFQSEASKETSKAQYEFVRQPDGEWLLKWVM